MKTNCEGPLTHVRFCDARVTDRIAFFDHIAFFALAAILYPMRLSTPVPETHMTVSRATAMGASLGPASHPHRVRLGSNAVSGEG